MLPIFRLRATYISLIKKYPKGQASRLPHFDEWVTTWHDPNIHTYYQYFYNLQTRQHPVFLPDSQKAKQALNTAESNFRPGLARFHQRFFPSSEHFADDQLPSATVQDMTLKTFFQGFTKKQTRNDLQRLLFWGVTGILSGMLYYWTWVINADDQQLIAQIEPHPSFYNYQITSVRSYVHMCIDKIQFLEGHSRQVLEEARKRALKRAADS